MANKSVLTIVYQLAKQGNADKDVLSGLKSVQAGVTQAMGVFGALVGVAYTVNKAFQATAGVFVSYAAQVRELNRLTGAGSEETSRLIQMADDLTISYEGLQKSLWFASKNGVEVNVESLSRLADEYVALAGPTEQAEFLARKFGKSGLEMAKMLEQGGNAVREWAGSIEGSLVLTDQAVQEAREYELAVDQLNDEVQALKVSIGSDLVHAITEFINYGKQHVDVMKQISAETGETYTRGLHYAAMIQETDRAVLQFTSGLDSAGVSYRAMAEAAGFANTQITETGETVDQVNERNQDMLGLVMNLQSQYDSYTESLAGLTEKMTALKDEQSQYLEGSTRYDELQTEIDQTGAAIEQLAADHENAQKRIAFSLLQQKLAVDGLTDSEFDNLLTIGQSWGILDAEVVTAAQNMNRAVNQISSTTAGARHQTNLLHKQWEKLMQLSGSTVEFFVVIKTSGRMPAFSSNTGQMVTTNKPAAGTPTAAFAEGGQLGQGWAWVGEKGRELVSPWGYVFPHAESEQLARAGLAPSDGFAMGGTLAQSDVDVRPYIAAPVRAQAAPARKRSRGNNDEVSAPAVSNAVTEAVAPMADTTSQAVESAQSIQQSNLQMVAEIKDSNRALAESNNRLADEIRRNSATMKNTILASVEQMRG